MGNTSLMRVGAVENAFCAFSKELVDAFCASTAPAASMRALSPCRMAHGRQRPRALIEARQSQGGEVQHPDTIVDFFEADGLAGEHLREMHLATAPRDLADRRPATHVPVPGIVDGRQPRGKGPARSDVPATGHLVVQGFMRSFVVV